jgi:two-component system, sensor histidine kinase
MIPASKLEPGVQRELFRLGYKNILASNIGGFAAAVLMGLTLWDMRHTQGVLIWTVCALCSNSLAWFLLVAFRKPSKLQGDSLSLSVVSRWRTMHTVFIVASACVWGGSGALLDINDPRGNALIMAVILAILAFSASSHGMHNILSYLLSAVLSLPIMLIFLKNAFVDSVTPIMVLFLLFAVVCTIIAINAHRTMIDAIRLKLANQDLAVQRTAEAQRADQANRDKSNFLAAAAHDMRQPVHALQMLQGLLRQSDQPQKSRAIIDQMDVATRSIGQLFDSVMELTKLESNQAIAKMEPIEIDAFITDRVKQHLPIAAQKGLRIRVYKSRSVAGAWVNADPLLLMRVVDNLIGNALRYTEKGGILIGLRRHSPRKFYLEVWDTGIGIATDNAQRIFSPYVQIDNPVRSREKGLGLGLAIVKNSLLLMASDIELRSVVGKGSRFRFLLTKVAAPATQKAKANVPTRAPLTTSLEGKQILIIEDDPLVANALVVVLRQWGAKTRHAISLDQLSLGQWVPDLIISDQRLPGQLDGLQTLESLKSRFPQAACILQTGELSADIPLKAHARGYTLLVKPVSIDVFGKVLNDALSTQRKI